MLSRVLKNTLLAGVAALCLFGQTIDYSQIKNTPTQRIAEYAFSLKIGNVTSGSLSTSGAKTLTIRPCPRGVAGANTNHYIRIYGGTGTAETPLITGGSCTSGGASGTLQFTTVNTHTGDWTIGSASGGITEWFYGASAPLNGYLPTDVTRIYAKVTLYGRSGNTVRIVGQGMPGTNIYRDSSYPSGDLIYYDSSLGAGQLIMENLTITNASGFGNPSGAGLHLYLTQPREALISYVDISNGNAPVLIEGTGTGTSVFHSCRFIIYSAYHSVYGSGDVITMNSGAGDFVDVTAVIQVPTVSTTGSGMRIIRSDGIKISGGGYSGKHGIKVENDPANILNFIYIDNATLFDSSYSHSFYIPPGSHNAVYNQIRIQNCQFATQSGDTSASGIYIGNDPEALTITGNNISGYYGSGITLGVTDNVPRSVVIQGNQINNNGLGASGYGIVIAPTGSGGSGSYDTDTIISGNVIGNNISNYGAPTQDVGIYFAGAAGKFRGYTIEGNDLRGNTVAAIFKDASPTMEGIAIGTNRGISDTFGVVASASLSAANAASFYRNIEVTGTTAVTALTPVWDGRTVSLFKTDAGTVTVGGAGDFAGASASLNQYGRIDCTYYVSLGKWFIK